MITPYVISLLVLCGFAIGMVREHVFVNNQKSWWDAQSYCRQHFKDLSTINSTEENEMVKTAAGQNFPSSWIGLHRDWSYPSIWEWSDNQQVSFTLWKHDEPSGGDEKCVRIRDDGWSDDKCDEKCPFFCERTLIVVRENKTWEEAYEHCRTQYTGLACLISSVQLDLKYTETQTDSVWTGLRFLAGEWFWVNGEPLGSLVSLPSCPAQPYRCGARNSKRDVWENRACEEKLNFLCF